MQNLSIVIFGAHFIPRMKGCGPPVLFKDNGGKPILLHQIKILKNRFPRAEIVVITGLWADKIANIKTNDFRIIENQLYETTNEIENLRLAINNIQNNNLLIIPGDIIFNSRTFDNIPEESFVIYDNRNQLNTEIGMTVVDKNATVISFDLPSKYTGIVYIHENLFPKFKKLCLDRNNNRLFLFEIINNILNCGIKIRAYDPPAMKITKITKHDQFLNKKDSL